MKNDMLKTQDMSECCSLSIMWKVFSFTSLWTALKKIMMILKLKVWELSGFAFYGNKDINYDEIN